MTLIETLIPPIPPPAQERDLATSIENGHEREIVAYPDLGNFNPYGSNFKMFETLVWDANNSNSDVSFRVSKEQKGSLRVL